MFAGRTLSQGVHFVCVCLCVVQVSDCQTVHQGGGGMRFREIKGGAEKRRKD